MINPRDKYLTAAGEMGSGIRILQQDLWAVSYTHLDVYKRQGLGRTLEKGASASSPLTGFLHE